MKILLLLFLLTGCRQTFFKVNTDEYQVILILKNHNFYKRIQPLNSESIELDNSSVFDPIDYTFLLINENPYKTDITYSSPRKNNIMTYQISVNWTVNIHEPNKTVIKEYLLETNSESQPITQINYFIKKEVNRLLDYELREKEFTDKDIVYNIILKKLKKEASKKMIIIKSITVF